MIPIKKRKVQRKEGKFFPAGKFFRGSILFLEAFCPTPSGSLLKDRDTASEWVPSFSSTELNDRPAGGRDMKIGCRIETYF